MSIVHTAILKIDNSDHIDKIQFGATNFFLQNVTKVRAEQNDVIPRETFLPAHMVSPDLYEELIRNPHIQKFLLNYILFYCTNTFRDHIRNLNMQKFLLN